MKYIPTEQQQAIIDTVTSNVEGKVVAVVARAGCTKTSTAKLVVNAVKPKRALYFAFNKAIVEEGAESFTSNVECRTLHALAYKYIQPGNIEAFTYMCIKEKLSYPDKLKILNVVDEFFRSSSIDIYTYLEDFLDDKKLIEIAASYVEKMANDEMPIPFNFLLKQLHLMLAQDLITIDYDLVLHDEAADTTEVAVEIFKLINSPKKMMLGDDLQSIFSFMNLVDGFALIENPIHLELTKSFRCNTKIAKRTEAFVKKTLDKSFEFEGFDRGESDDSKMFISATNSQLVLKMQELIKQGTRFRLLRDVKEIFAPTLALANASRGAEVYHKKYKFLEKEYKNYAMSNYKSFFSYLKKEVPDEEIHIAIDTLSHFNKEKINIFDLMNKVKKMRADPNVILCTAFTAKGLEVDRVEILNDLNLKIYNIIEQGGAEDENDRTMLQVAYVAMTRARFHLDNCLYA